MVRDLVAGAESASLSALSGGRAGGDRCPFFQNSGSD